MLVLDASAQDNYTSAQSGDWNVSSTWTPPSWLPNTTPDNSQTVTISAGHTVTYTGDLTYSQDITIDGTLIVTGSFTHGNFLTVSSTGSLIVGGNILTNGFNIAGKVKAEGNYTGTSGNTNIISSTGKILIGGNAQTSINITVFGEMLVSGNYTQTGGTININDTGFLVVGKNFQNDWQDVYINNSGKLLIIGSLITNEINKAPDAQIAVLGDLIIGTYNQTLENLDCSEYCKQSLDCPSCQILDVIDPTHPDWILSEGITSFWWEDFNENAVGSTSEGTKWTTIISGANSGANVQVLNSPNKVLYFSNNGSTGNKTLWQTEEIIIQCYKNVSISGYTYNESTGSTSINHLYYRLKATSAGTWGSWTQLSRSASGYNLAPDINAYSVQIKWAVNTNKSCWLDNVGVSGTAICGDESSLSITCPGDQTENLNSNCQYILPDYTSLATISGGDGTVSLAQSPVAGTIISTATLITITATDQGVGNENCSFNVILTDIEDPVLSSCPSDIFIVSSDGNPVVVSWTVPTATDNCSATVTSTHDSGDSFSVGTTTVTYTATDSSGNQSFCSFDVTVIEAGGGNPPAPVFLNDYCTYKPITIASAGSLTNYQVKLNVAYDSPMNADFSDLRFSLEDGTLLDYWIEDYTASTSATIWVEVPAISAGYNYIYMFYGSSSATSLSDITTAMIQGLWLEYYTYAGGGSPAESSWTLQSRCDDIGTPINYNWGDNAINFCGQSNANYVVLRWTGWLRKASGAETNFAFQVGSDDGLRVYLDGGLVHDKWSDGGYSIGNFNYSFNEDVVPIQFDFYENGGGAQVSMAWDISGGTFSTIGVGNFYHASYTNSPPSIFIGAKAADNIDPVINNCPSDLSISSYDGGAVAASWTVPTATDNCSVNLSSDYNPGDNFPVGQTIVTYTATDDDGNSATCSFTVTVVDDLKLSAAATDIQCIGNNDGTITATASGGVDPYEYKINEGSYQSSGNFSNLSEGDYTVWVKDSQGVEADSTVTISQPTSADDQNLAGADSWIGHVYKRLDTQNSPPSDVNAFTNYVGNISENETFFHDFGGSCFQVYSSGAPFVTVDPNYFAVRYRMNSSKSGIYLVNIGSDDGARLTIDGDLVYNQWRERGLVTDQRNLIQLTGSSNLLLEYYESGGGNQIAFDVLEKVSNEITADVMTSCGTTPATPISGNNAYTESPISSNTNFSISYQWQGASDLSGSWGDIDGATSQNYTPTLSIADTYYFRRILFVEKTNPGGIHVTAKDTSNVSTVVHYNIQLSSLIKNTSCNGFSDGEIDLTVSGGVSPYSFVWTSTDGVGYVASDEDQTGLTAGTYEVTVTDNNGCTSTGGYTVDIAEDVTKPSISCPAGNTVDCVKNMPVGATDYNSFVAAGGSASDNCTTQENLSITYQDVTDPGVNCKVTRTYTVTDDAGNSSTCDQIFTVTDNTSPQINCTSIEMEINSGCEAVYTVLAPDVSDFCSFGDIQPSYSYRLGNDSGNTEITGFGDVNNETFPLGATTITWSIEDECGNSSSCDQLVSVIFPITPIDYDDGAGTSSPGSGIQPLQTSTHTYQVDGGISESGYTYDWKLEDGSGNAVTSGYTINGDGTASISITYNTDTDTLSTGNYILSIIKTKNTTCEQSETLAISILSNGGFDVSIEDLSDQQCQTPSSTTTTYIWQITFQDGSGTNQPFQFDYAVQLEGSTMQSGTVSSFYLSDEWNLKPPASGDFPLVQTRKVANSSIIELVFTFANAPDLDRNIQVVIQNTKGAYSVSEPDVTNNTDAVKASKIPTISFE